MGKTVKLPISNFLLDEPHAHADKLWGPYPSVDAAAAAIPTAMKVASFKFGVISNGVFSEYIYLEDNGTPQELASLKVQLLLNPASGAVAGKILSLNNELKPIWVDPSSTAERVSFDNSEEVFDGDVSTTQAAIEALKDLLDTLDGDVVKGILVNGSEVSIENGVASITIPDAVTSVIANNELVFQTPDGQSVKGKVGVATGADGLLHLTLTDEEGNTYSSPIAGLRVNGNALQYSNDGETWVTVQTFGNLAIKYVQASDPVTGDDGDLALVGSTNAYVLKVYVGGSWVSVGDFGTLDLTSDGITMAGENKTLTEKLNEMTLVEVESQEMKGSVKWSIGAVTKQGGTDTNSGWIHTDIISFEEPVYISFKEQQYNLRIAYYNESDVFLYYQDLLDSFFVGAGVKFRLGLYGASTVVSVSESPLYKSISIGKGGFSQQKNHWKNSMFPNMTVCNSSATATTGTDTSYLIPIPEGVTQVKAKRTGTKLSNLIAFFNSSYTQLQRYNSQTTPNTIGTYRTVDVPVGAVYMAYQFEEGYIDIADVCDTEDNVIYKPQNSIQQMMEMSDAIVELREKVGSGTDDEKAGAFSIYEDYMDQIRSGSNALKLIHFSDIHGDGVRLQRILTFAKKYEGQYSDIIQTGDLVSQKYSNGISFFTSVEGHEKILNVIGNHDSSTTGAGDWSGIDAATCYNTFVAPFKNNWGTAVVGENVCYYYKDYGACRLIVLDRYHFDDTQKTWFLDLLSNSLDKHVVVASHYAPAPLVSYNKECNMESYDGDAGARGDCPTLDGSVLDAVDTFMNNGGKFVCWIGGHLHWDAFRQVAGHLNQVCVIVDTANPVKTVASVRTVGKQSEDNFNVFSVNPVNGTFAIRKVGSASNKFGMSRQGLVYDYFNHKIIMQF